MLSAVFHGVNNGFLITRIMGITTERVPLLITCTSSMVWYLINFIGVNEEDGLLQHVKVTYQPVTDRTVPSLVSHFGKRRQVNNILP